MAGKRRIVYTILYIIAALVTVTTIFVLLFGYNALLLFFVRKSFGDWPDRYVLLAAVETENQTVRVLEFHVSDSGDLQPYSERMYISADEGCSVHTMAVSQAGVAYFSVLRESLVRIKFFEGGNEKVVLPASPVRVCLANDGSRVASLLSTGMLVIHNLRTGAKKEIPLLKDARGSRTRVACLQFCPSISTKLLVVIDAGDGCARLFVVDCEDGKWTSAVLRCRTSMGKAGWVSSTVVAVAEAKTLLVVRPNGQVFRKVVAPKSYCFWRIGAAVDGLLPVVLLARSKIRSRIVWILNSSGDVIVSRPIKYASSLNELTLVRGGR